MKSLIIIPAYNESENIIKVIDSLQETCPTIDYLVVNDCSTDETSKKLQAYRASYISVPVNLGIGGAVQAGYKYALENNYDIAIQLDGDGQHDPKYIGEMIRLIENEHVDIVIGSRFIEKEGFQSSNSRRIGINILSTLIFLTCGKRVIDVTSGYRAVNRKFIALYAENYPDDYPEPEAIEMAVLNGGKIRELPVIMRERISGKSSIDLKKSVYYMIKVSLAIVICRISLGIRRKK